MSNHNKKTETHEEIKTDKKYKLETEDLALPEVKTGKVEATAEEETDEEISYETLAIPEIHIKHKKKN